MTPAAALALDGLTAGYSGSAPVADGFSLRVEPGEMVALLGPSGCGKTTILRLIAGLLRPTGGTIHVDGADVTPIPAEARRTALVFQKPLLFPHLTVAGNIAFSLRLRKRPAAEIAGRVRDALSLVKLSGLEDRLPHQLSGGQEQRVSLARALVSDPRILLLDEPFAALDENLRAEMRSLVRGIQRGLGITSVLVTHDRAEAAAIAHRIAFMSSGRVVQHGSPRDFYESPATLETARFFGLQVWKGCVASGQLTSALGAVPLPAAAPGPVWICAQSRALSIAVDETANATVESSVDLGDRILTTVRTVSGEPLEVLHNLPLPEFGGAVRLRCDAKAIRLFPRDDSQS